MTSPEGGPTAPAYVELVHTMGTVVTVDIRAAVRPANLQAALDAVTGTLWSVDAAFSTWQDDSWVSRLLSGRIELGRCPSEVREVVSLSEQMAELTGGYFSPYWRGSAPDPTGLVKGWAAQRASDLLVAHGLPDHVVNAAGDLVVSGSSDPRLAGSRSAWRVGIADPATAGAFAGVVELPDLGRWAVATSGTFELGAHVVDPHDGRAPTVVASATTVVRVGSPHRQAGAVADACATALVAAGERAGPLLTRLGPNLVRGLLIGADGGIVDPDRLLAARPDDPGATPVSDPRQ